jgi:Flp pilus assembly protein TadG
MIEQLRLFARAKAGNVVLTFALATIPLIGFVGAAVDYSRGNSAKAAMQAAVDATALMMTKNVGDLNSRQTGTEASNYFHANFNRTDVSDIIVTPVYTDDNGPSSLSRQRAPSRRVFSKSRDLHR